MMDFHGTRVLLLDGFCRQNAVLLKELHGLGCAVTTLNNSRLDVGYTSRYPVRRLLDTQFATDLEHYEHLILELARSGQYDVIFPVLEEATEILSRQYAELTKYVKVVAPPYEAFEKAWDKQLTMELCMDNGIPCPKTKRDSETLEEYLATVSFPLALKPRKGHGSMGFKKVCDRDKLDRLIADGTVRVEDYVIQEFVEQAETHRVSYTVLDGEGRVCSSLIARSSRPYPLGIGTNSLFESVDMPAVREQAERLLQLTGWRGYASVCFIESEKDGVPLVMEINGRISASFKVSVLTGLPIVRQLLELAYGVPVTPAPDTLRYGCRITHSQSETLWRLKSPDRFRKESKAGQCRKQDVVFSIQDPLPYVGYSLQCVLKYRKELKKRER